MDVPKETGAHRVMLRWGRKGPKYDAQKSQPQFYPATQGRLEERGGPHVKVRLSSRFIHRLDAISDGIQ